MGLEKKRLKVVEIGASSLLDFDYSNDPQVLKSDFKIEWIKHYNVNVPKYYDKIYSIKGVSSDNMQLRSIVTGADVIIYSIGNKGSRVAIKDQDPEEMHDIWNVNFGKILSTLPRVIKMSLASNSLTKIIFMGSVAGKEGATYPNHAIYASCKAALKSLVNNLIEENKFDKRKVQFKLLEIDYTSSRMTGNKGLSPDGIRSEIIDLIIN